LIHKLQLDEYRAYKEAMTVKMDGGQQERRVHSAWTFTRRDVLVGPIVVVVVAALAVTAAGSETSHDVFASTEHLRLLADSERQLVASLRQYVTDERQRLQHILRSTTCSTTTNAPCTIDVKMFRNILKR